MNDHTLSSDFLDVLQRETFDYFVYEANPLNGLIADKTQAGSPASIAAVGFALSVLSRRRGARLHARADAIARTLATLRFFQDSVQSADADATGYKGFYYHFPRHGQRKAGLEMRTVHDRHRAFSLPAC